MSIAAKRICLYFGSFNPIHIGHLVLARYARDRVGFDEVWLVLSPLNPQKQGRDQLPYDSRVKLIEHSLEGERGLRLCTLERYLPSPHYTVRSVRALRMLYPEAVFALLIGADNLASLSSWYETERLQRAVSIYVYPRPGVDLADSKIQPQGEDIHICADAPLVDISSTEIRQAIYRGEPIEHLLPRRDLAPMLREQLLALSAH